MNTYTYVAMIWPSDCAQMVVIRLVKYCLQSTLNSYKLSKPGSSEKFTPCHLLHPLKQGQNEFYVRQHLLTKYDWNSLFQVRE